MTRNRLFVTLAVIMLVADVSPGAERAVEPDKENVVSSRLEGNWRLHASLTQRLTGNARWQFGTLCFKSDPSVAGKIPDNYARAFTERKLKVYLAGYLKFKDDDHPFVVTNVHGNPYVLYWLERDGDPFGNGESFNVMLAVANDKQNDLLFVGGDFNNQSFSAFERVQPDPQN